LSKKTLRFWVGTVQCGAIDIFINLVGSGQTNTLANACYFLGYWIMEDASVWSKVLTGETTKQILKLLGLGNETSIRAEAADALKSHSAKIRGQTSDRKL
jgi:hypothetical protein